jgi:2'-5' RNA ligase
MIDVIWVGILKSLELEELQAKVEEALPGYRKEHGFKPHVTLARVGFVKDRDRLLKSISGINKEAARFHIDGFFLFKSELTPYGPVYTKLKEFRGAS